MFFFFQNHLRDSLLISHVPLLSLASNHLLSSRFRVLSYFLSCQNIILNLGAFSLFSNRGFSRWAKVYSPVIRILCHGNIVGLASDPLLGKEEVYTMILLHNNVLNADLNLNCSPALVHKDCEAGVTLPR